MGFFRRTPVRTITRAPRVRSRLRSSFGPSKLLLSGIIAGFLFVGCGDSSKAPPPKPPTHFQLVLEREYPYLERDTRVVSIYPSRKVLESKANKETRREFHKLAKQTSESFAITVLDYLNRSEIPKKDHSMIIAMLRTAIENYKIINGSNPSLRDLQDLIYYHLYIKDKSPEEKTAREIAFEDSVLKRFKLSEFHTTTTNLNPEARDLLIELKNLTSDHDPTIAVSVVNFPHFYVLKYLPESKRTKPYFVERSKYFAQVLNSLITAVKNARARGLTPTKEDVYAFLSYVTEEKGDPKKVADAFGYSSVSDLDSIISSKGEISSQKKINEVKEVTNSPLTLILTIIGIGALVGLIRRQMRKRSRGG